MFQKYSCQVSKPSDVSGGIFSKRVTDDDDRRKTFFLASRGEDSSLIHRVVIMVMEYRIVACPLAIATSDVRTLPAGALQKLQLSFEKLSVVVELRTFVPDHVAIYIKFFFEVKEQLFEQTFCHLTFPVRGRRRAVEKFESSFNIGDRVHELPFPSRQTVKHTAVMPCSSQGMTA